MASINGITVKNLKGFEGWEGYCYQGNIYLNGKKLGFWSQDSHGGPDRFDFSESALDKACKDYQNGFPDTYKYKAVCDSKEVIMDAVVRLKEMEKDCKKSFKEGWKAVYYMTDRFHSVFLGIPDVLDISAIRKKYPGQVKDMEECMFKSGYAEHVFTPDAFDIIIDRTHPAPDLFITI